MNTEKLLIEIRKSIEETQNRLTAVIALVEKLQDSIDEDLYEAYGGRWFVGMACDHEARMVILTPYDKEHYEFLDSLLFEPYDSGTKNDIYNFYDIHDLFVYLPKYLRDTDNRLDYIVEFEDGLYRIYITDKIEIWKVKE
jgi:hypothetical protein